MNFLKKNKQYYIFSFLFSLFAIIFALYYQYIENYLPCELCIYQRIPYFIIILISSYAFLVNGNKNYMYFIGFLFLTSLVISITHFGVEQEFWQINSSCSNNTMDFENIDQLKAFLEDVPITKCNEITWSLFGISMAGYNVIYSIINILISIFYCKITTNEK